MIFSFPFLLFLLRYLFQTLATCLYFSFSCSKSQFWTGMCLIPLVQLATLPFTWAWTMLSFNTDTHFRWKSDVKEEVAGRPFCVAISNDVHYVGCIFFLFKNSVSLLSPKNYYPSLLSTLRKLKAVTKTDLYQHLKSFFNEENEHLVSLFSHRLQLKTACLRIAFHWPHFQDASCLATTAR